MAQVNLRDCKHGRLGRTCEICEMEVTISNQQAIIAEMSGLLFQCKEELKTWNAIFAQQHGGTDMATEKLIEKINKVRG